MDNPVVSSFKARQLCTSEHNLPEREYDDIGSLR